jgi:DNA-binding beta-propeller fold protein YncE
VHDVSFGPEGRVAVAITGLSLVAVWAEAGQIGGEPELVLEAPRTEGALAHTNGRIYAMASGVGVLVAYQGSEVVAAVQGHFGAHDVAEDLEGNVWVADTGNRRLVKYSPALERLQVIDAAKFGFLGPRYLDVTETGMLAVADQDAHRILLIDPEGPEGGTLVGVLGENAPGLGPGRFDDPEGIAVRGSRFWISDSDNNRIVRYAVVTN